MDYDRRLQAYSSLRAEPWAGMGSTQALPLLHQSLADMRRTDDLAIRSAAAQALGRLITAAKLDSARVETLQGERDELTGSIFCTCCTLSGGEPLQLSELHLVSHGSSSSLKSRPAVLCRRCEREKGGGPGAHHFVPAAQAHCASAKSGRPPGATLILPTPHAIPALNGQKAMDGTAHALRCFHPSRSLCKRALAWLEMCCCCASHYRMLLARCVLCLEAYTPSSCSGSYSVQEHVELLRALALAFPEQYPDLHALTDTDAELDFFNNVAHLQLHRRSRAFKRLGNVSACPLLSCHFHATCGLTPEWYVGILTVLFSWSGKSAEATPFCAGLSRWTAQQQHAHGHCSAPAAAGHP